MVIIVAVVLVALVMTERGGIIRYLQLLAWIMLKVVVVDIKLALYGFPGVVQEAHQSLSQPQDIEH